MEKTNIFKPNQRWRATQSGFTFIVRGVFPDADKIEVYWEHYTSPIGVAIYYDPCDTVNRGIWEPFTETAGNLIECND